VINWGDFSKALHEIGYEGVFSLETDVKSAGLSPEEYKAQRIKLAQTAKRLANG
jgi:sugar phosphate isomerase/epimerase